MRQRVLGTPVILVRIISKIYSVYCVWNVMVHAQKPDFVFRRNGRVHLNRRGSHFSRLLAGEVCASAVVMLDTPCSEVVWIILATNSIHQFPLLFPSRAATCAITFQLESTAVMRWEWSEEVQVELVKVALILCTSSSKSALNLISNR
jgi:hypothetical protein